MDEIWVGCEGSKVVPAVAVGSEVGRELVPAAAVVCEGEVVSAA